MDKASIINALKLSGNNNLRAAEMLKVPLRTFETHKRRCGLTSKKETLPPPESIDYDSKLDIINSKTKDLEGKYKLVSKENQMLRELLEASQKISTIDSHIIVPKKHHKHHSNLTALALFSDTHGEETVTPESVNGMNEYNLKIARKRCDMFFVSLVRLITIFQKESNIQNLILALLGDFINGQLREEAMENNSLRPTEALLFMAEIITSGIEYVLNNSTVDLTIPCHCGNHSRITKKVHHSTEVGNSLEYLMYHQIADHFRGNERVKFIIPKSYHSFIDIEGYVLRFHHGHNIKYNGGVGGIYISVNKAIAQWNKVRRADLDIFAHFHQLRDGGNFITNGSVIGWNTFANSIKADFEKPKQAFCLIDHKRKEKTLMAQVFLEESKK